MSFRLLSLTMLCLVSVAFAKPDAGYADLVERIQDGVVRIDVTQKAAPAQADPFSFFFQGQGFQRQMPRSMPPQQGSGTGFVISADGYIVTNRHVVDDATNVKVNFPKGKVLEAKVIGSGQSLDIALLKVEAHDLQPLQIGDSDKIRIGDAVLALGFPLQLGFSVTSGIVSGIGRDMRTELDVASYIQTDADITFGNSGGPLVNTKGEVIAINTMIVSRGETYGFSIPSKLFMNSIDQLREHGKVKHGALGVSIQNLDEESKDYYKLDSGALVGGVTKGMPADQAGVRDGDIILAIDGKKVNTANDVITEVGRRRPGDKIKLSMLANGKETTRDVVLSDRDKLFGNEDPTDTSVGASSESSGTGLGFEVEPLDANLRRQLELDASTTGVVVTSVDPSSMAAQKGVREGAVLTSIDNHPVKDPSDVANLTKPLKSGQTTALRLLEVNPNAKGDSRSNRLVVVRKE